MKTTEKIKCIFERVYVETPVDTDGDGKRDLIACYIRRPEYNLNGDRVPAVLVANPYLMTCNEDWYDLNDVDRDVAVYPAQNIDEKDIRFDYDAHAAGDTLPEREPRGLAETAVIPEDIEFECISPLYAYLNQKGYASVFTGGPGTRGSDGFTLTGSYEEVLAFKSVIDWLCGRARAFTDRTRDIEIRADWCTGSVAMSGKSYLGTMCIAVAATGVEGLKTVIPEAGISSWYNYYRAGGLTVAPLEWQGDDISILAKYCFSRAKDEDDYNAVRDDYEAKLREMRELQDRDSGNYNLFWDERNYLNRTGNFKASVFIIHGLNDWNVKTNQCLPLFKALEEHGIECRMLLHQGEHIYVYDLEGSGTLGMVERWLDHYLRGADNGAEREPRVLVESNLDQLKWTASDTWPPEGTEYEEFPAAVPDTDLVIRDDLSATCYDREKDNQSEWLSELVLSEDGDYKNRIRFIWDPFRDGERELRISGTVRVHFDAALNRGTAILSAMLVDMGEAKRLTAEEVPVDDGEDAGTFRFGIEDTPSPFKVISRGWLNAQNRNCLWSKEETVPGREYSYEIDMVPTDYTLAEGHRLALILYGTDAQATQRPYVVTEITIRGDSVRAGIPVVRLKR